MLWADEDFTTTAPVDEAPPRWFKFENALTPFAGGFSSWLGLSAKLAAFAYVLAKATESGKGVFNMAGLGDARPMLGANLLKS